jgi:hypothetical protein
MYLFFRIFFTGFSRTNPELPDQADEKPMSMSAPWRPSDPTRQI